MDISESVGALKKDGFVTLNAAILTGAEVEELRTLTADAYESASRGHEDYISHKAAQGMRRLPQHHPRIAQLLDRIVSDERVRYVLRDVLGQDYKIWQIDMRRGNPDQPGLALHQDASGQMNMCISLTDNPEGFGSTVFLPRSHLAIRRASELKVEAPPPLLMAFRFLFTPLVAKAGDVAFFLNRTWHGRFPNRSKDRHDVILIGFFPGGGSLVYNGYGDWAPEFLTAMQGTELGRLIDPSIGTRRQENGHYEILATDLKSPYSLSLETQETQRIGLRAEMSIALLRLTMGVGRPFARLLRRIWANPATVK